MTLFSSKTPRDLNHDPKPWHCPGADEIFRIADGDQFECDVFVPRPEFDHVPLATQGPNPILVAARNAHRDGHLDAFIEGFMSGPPFEHEHPWVTHARRVLTRLAQIGASA